MVFIMFLVFLFLVCLVVFWFTRKRKSLNLPDVTLVSGGVKTGKSTLAFTLALRAFRRAVFRVRLLNLFRKKSDRQPLPLLYSNIPLGVPHVRLTDDVLYMRSKVIPKSVVYIDEASLLCDSMDFKNTEKNESVKLFFKLWGHISHGGKLFMSTHTPKDVHYNVKRSLANYLFIVKSIKWLPFFYLCKVREMIYCTENVQNVYDDDIEQDETSYWVLCPKRNWRYFDCFCYSSLVDDLQNCDDVVVDDVLKTSEVLTFEN